MTGSMSLQPRILQFDHEGAHFRKELRDDDTCALHRVHALDEESRRASWVTSVSFLKCETRVQRKRAVQ